MRNTIFLPLLFISLISGDAQPVFAGGSKDDFRGLETGMSRSEAREAAKAHGGSAETSA